MDINLRKLEIQEEIVKIVAENNFYCAVILPTGGGKTYAMLKCLDEIRKLNNNKINGILYCCNSRDLRDTDFPNELKKWGYGNWLKKIDRLCYQSAYKLQGLEYDVGLMDEFDFAATPQYIKVLLNNRFKYLILVSATLEDKKLRMLKGIRPKIPIVYKKELGELENENVLNKSRYHYVNYLLTERENRKYLDFNRLIAAMLKDDDNNQDRVQFILRQRKHFLNKLDSSASVCRRLLKEIEGRTLVFSELTDQIDRITEYTYHGGNAEKDKLKDFDVGKIRTLGVVGKVDRGVNINNVENIVLESCSSSKTKIVQKLGRGKRLHVDEFLDVYLLVPYYKAKFPKNQVKPTIVASWLEKALKDFNIPKELISTYQFKN